MSEEAVKVPDIIRHKGNVASFGGNSLTDNMEQAEAAIAKMEYTERIWDRSRSQFTLKNLVTAFPSDWKNLRQISAEMQRKKGALHEAKFNYAKKLAEAEIKRCEIAEMQEDIDQGHWRIPCLNKMKAQINLLEIEVAEIMEGAEQGIPKIEGAMKELITMEQMHDSLVERLGEVGEDAYERHEARSHIKYALIQAVREHRAMGRINTGVQEYIEQCGMNVTHVRLDITKYMGIEAEADSSTEALYEWLEKMADKYEQNATDQTKRLGFDSDHIEAITYNPERDVR